ncbi:hypothetical protein OSB04_022092 [Centaurea solstitialis]|uniref:EARLY FLOWERING 3 n=1 Tax=Centaurea solstitialis TaxID=347529 RepID=A0AA38SX34_9ASTR|nr:hypothetical protein OSB04_022092 [Centaurea solstitialis]
MKRRIDDKNMWPMFPRLHVNDIEKGGPRAPPRNKMALYEQLISMPSSQVDMSQSGPFFPLERTPTIHVVDKTNNRLFDLNNQLVQREQKKKQEDNDFRVPILVQQYGANLGHSDPSTGDVDSEISMVDSISEDDISPDNVVGVIGHNHFVQARRAILNQQKAFSGQVFELHRLVEVQKLIAGTPQPMVEDDAFLGKLATVAPIEKTQVEYALKSSTNVPKLIDYREKPTDDMRDFSIENVVEKASLFPVQNNHHPTFSGYPLPPSEPNFGSLGTNQIPGHQWLIPVMSPSEGLIYKPYPGPAYVLPGPEAPTSAPIIGHNFVNHGVPPPAQSYQWPTVHPSVPPAAHGYLPPYGTTTMNPSGAQEMNPFNMQNVPVVAKFHPLNDNEVQLSLASGPSNTTRDQDTLSLFPTWPLSEDRVEPTRAIRVVAHDAQSATESGARIFQSMQEERDQPKGICLYDPITTISELSVGSNLHNR